MSSGDIKLNEGPHSQSTPSRTMSLDDNKLNGGPHSKCSDDNKLNGGPQSKCSGDNKLDGVPQSQFTPPLPSPGVFIKNIRQKRIYVQNVV